MLVAFHARFLVSFKCLGRSQWKVGSITSRYSGADSRKGAWEIERKRKHYKREKTYSTQSTFCRTGGTVALWLVRLTPDRAVVYEALPWSFC